MKNALDGSLGLDGRNGRVDILRYNVSTKKEKKKKGRGTHVNYPSLFPADQDTRHERGTNR